MNKSEVAEILGAFIGDGWIESRKKAAYILGNKIEDKSYYDNYLAPLFFKNFKYINVKMFEKWNVYGIAIYRKKIIKILLELGFPAGKKCYDASIPKYFFNSKNKKIYSSIIKGLFDADGCFWCEKSRAKTSCEWKRTHHYHPELCITSCSAILLFQIKEMLDFLGIDSKVAKRNNFQIKNNRNNKEAYILRVRKLKEIKKWFKIIGTNNPKHKTKYEVWKKLGYLPTKTTLNERIELLNN
ncbi:MAG: LAGLIDADG family homing endonuclease [Candidatus Nanoarchaeia archaeon]|nr:LAGLIDADG family homing endonuclease [Candidatus Nanoarchaeia archaeon]